jgi:hypothetical protein
VFVTSADGVDTTWVIVDLDRLRHSATYVRVTPGRHAGTVMVSCAEERPGHCTVTVRYDLTALDGGDTAALDHYRPASFARTIESWREALGAHLADLRS